MGDSIFALRKSYQAETFLRTNFSGHQWSLEKHGVFIGEITFEISFKVKANLLVTAGQSCTIDTGNLSDGRDQKIFGLPLRAAFDIERVSSFEFSKNIYSSTSLWTKGEANADQFENTELEPKNSAILETNPTRYGVRALI